MKRSPDTKPTAPEDFDRAQAHAFDCACTIFTPKQFQALVSTIPDPPFDFQDSHPIEPLIARVQACATPEGLKRFVDEDANLWQLMVVAWAYHCVIQQVNEARINGGETHFGRYKDLLSKPNPWQVCMFGFSYLKFMWRG